MSALLAALVAASAVSLMGRARIPGPPAIGFTSGAARNPASSSTPDRGLTRRLRPIIAMLGFLAGWAFLGGWVGWLAGAAGAATLWTISGRIEDPAVVRRREQLTGDLPVAIDLLAASLAAGSSLEASLPRVADALGGVVAEELRAIHHRLLLGVNPHVVWGDVGQHPQLARFGRSVRRSIETGAPVQAALLRLADELTTLAVADTESRARSVEVRAAAPLGLCLLPAFVLLGIVPMVAGLFASMSIFG